MKKVYKFNLIPGVEFVEKDGFYYAASDDPVWPKSHLTKVIIEGLAQYEKNIATLYNRLRFVKRQLTTLEKSIIEKDKEIKTHKNTNSYLNNRIEYIKKSAENEIGHRNKLLDEKDKDIEYLREKNSNLDKVLHDTLISAINIINEKNSEIKVLSDQVTRLMDQLKEATEENPGCKECINGPEPCCDICGNTDCEHRVEKEAKPETNFDKIMRDMHSKLTPARLAEIIKTSECDGVSCEDCLFNSIAEPGYLSICDMPLGMLTKWLEENTKED